jgi:predicted Ser/Thr protein kinase
MIQKLSPLFLKLIDRSITRSEKDELKAYLDLLLDDRLFAQGEYDILLHILNKITSAESRQQIEQNLLSETNANKVARRRAQLDKTLDPDDVYYIRSIILKLQNTFRTDFYIAPEFSGTFPNGQPFQDFVISKSYIEHRVIGKGGFGKVFLLQFHEQSYVLKEMIIRNDQSLLSIRNEIDVLKQVIGKWYAVQLLAAGIIMDESFSLGKIGIAYILYPYIPGETLAEYQEIIHPEEEERAIYSQIIEAVEQLHAEIGILHSDIKPENIWIPTDRSIPPFLLDFGLVQSLQSNTARNVGTIFYWSEHRFRSKGKPQSMTPGINWLALARTLGSEITNNNARLLPPLRERFKKLYHNKQENTIRKNNVNRAIRGNVQQTRRNKVRAQRTLKRNTNHN